ncbi:hypothetical protein BDV24DRAFT_154651 [Aspergillus arachidicola]|uniref:O-methyltransferase n=1 Tax=Aspergillus arachidicola TaxID=656916 RepID=A0A2G7FVL8_9EURO|nr:hypothetical protein BDV24DRAFT_154651 [Aspergillus arachidicola]PIG84642.1 O-methyltransferase [Aspergillus arachidicola]
MTATTTTTTSQIFVSEDYNQDPNWYAVDNYTLSHLQPPTRPNHASLHQTLANSAKRGLEDISAFPTQAKFMALQCQLGGVKHALEVGTLGGYTAIYIASLNPDIRIVSIEIDPKSAEVAKENIAAAGYQDRIEVLVGAAIDLLPILQTKVENGEQERFGFTFIDANKDNGWDYFDYAVKMSRPRASIIVDNVVRAGKLVQEDYIKNDINVRGSRRTVENVGKDDRVDAVVLQTLSEKSYDGFLMAVVK